MTVTTGLVLFDDAEELDFVGPWEVFTMARREGDVVLTLAEHDRPVRCAKGLRVLPDTTLDQAPKLDVVVVPGGQGTRREVDNPTLTGWLAEVAPATRWVTSVCTGAQLLAGAGLVDDRRVTTHWAFIDELAAQTSATVVGDARYVRDGNVVTAAGVSAGIDMALWLVGQLYGVEHARLVQKMMEYAPAPPYAALV